MKAYDLYEEFFRLTPKDQEYVLGYFTGSLDCVATGFTTPHRDQAHANWAILELENAMKKKRKEDVSAQSTGTETRARVDALNKIVELTKSGYAGVLSNGNIVDRREHPEAIPIPKNSMFGTPEPARLPDRPTPDHWPNHD